MNVGHAEGTLRHEKSEMSPLFNFHAHTCHTKQSLKLGITHAMDFMDLYKSNRFMESHVSSNGRRASHSGEFRGGFN